MSEISASNEIKPLKIGVRFKSPAIILIYEENNEFHQRTMPIRGLLKNSSVRRVATGLKEHHENYLSQISNIKIEKLLRLIQENMKGNSLKESWNIIDEEFKIDPDEDLNKLDDESLKHTKEIMDLTFEKNRKKPGDPDFQYDVQIDFGESPECEKSVWDIDEDKKVSC